MTHLHARPATLALLIGALLVATPAAARSADKPGDSTAAPKNDYTTEADAGVDGLTTGSIQTPEQKRKRRFDDCMAIWEPATHMTKRQWRRTCNSQLDEFP